MEKIENQEVKEYLMDVAISYLENCELFTEVYGKDFARKQLEANLTKVYTNEFSNRERGYADIYDRSITICSNTEKSDLLTPEEIKNDIAKQKTCVHEALHIIFVKNGTQKGTGIVEQYENDTEIGRGFNEGLTNWIVKKAGLKPHSYIKLIGLIELLELALGEKRVMKMAEGNIRENVTKQLKMPYKKCIAFLSQIDEASIMQEQLEDISNIIKVLENYENVKDDETVDKEKAEADFLELNNNPTYIEFLQDDDYKKRLESINLEDSVPARKNYFKYKQHEYESKERRTMNKIRDTIYTRYFEREFQRLVQSRKISVDKMKKFDNLYSFVTKKKLKSLEIRKFKKLYQHLDERCKEQSLKEAKKAFAKGKLSGSKLEKLYELNDRGRGFNDADFFFQISKMISPINSKSVKDLLGFLNQNGELAYINEYSILKLTAGNTVINAYQRNGETLCKQESTGIIIQDDVRNLEDVLYTMETVKQFEQMYPNARVRSMDKLIIVENEGEESYYLIDNGQIVEPKIEIIKMDEVLNKPKRKTSTILLSSSTTTYCTNKAADRINKYEAFKENISDMSQYSDCVPKSSRTGNKSTGERTGK